MALLSVVLGMSWDCECGACGSVDPLSKGLAFTGVGRFQAGVSAFVSHSLEAEGVMANSRHAKGSAWFVEVIEVLSGPWFWRLITERLFMDFEADQSAVPALEMRWW